MLNSVIFRRLVEFELLRYTSETLEFRFILPFIQETFIISNFSYNGFKRQPPNRGGSEVAERGPLLFYA